MHVDLSAYYNEDIAAIAVRLCVAITWRKRLRLNPLWRLGDEITVRHMANELIRRNKYSENRWSNP